VADPVNVPPELANHPKFRIVRELGRGGMGVIYLAQHRVMDKPVALKVISPALLDQPSTLARFHAEVKAAGKLDHPNIARALDADQAGNLHFLVMEYVEGLTLAQLLKQQGPLPVAAACRHVHQAAMGLQHAFEQGMVHRDVKPANLMLTPQGRVKVMDFGLARLRSEQKDGRGLTQTGAFMGTPEYVAPEQATDARQADTRADVYSLGCTLYALLTGRPPFVADTMVKLVLAHLEKAPVLLHQLRPEVPIELSAVVTQMLAKDPAQRYQTPVEVARALAPFTKAGSPAGAVAPPPLPQASLLNQATVLPSQQSRNNDGVGKATAADTSPFAHLVDTPAPVPKKPQPERRWAIPLALTAAGVLVLAVLAVVLIQLVRPSGGNSERAGNTPSVPPAVATRPATPPRPLPLDCTGPAGLSAAQVQQAQKAWADYLGRPVEETIDIANGAQMVFVLVPPGKFRMGSPDGEEGHDTDETLHTVTLTEPFDLAKTEMTQAQYEALMGEKPSSFKGPDRPVETVSWNQAHDCAVRLTTRRGDGRLCRLPTEAEWEYCCRGGRSSSQPFGIGDGRALSSREANFNGNSPYGGAAKENFLQSTCRVGCYPKNALGLYDMHGNVWEWCADWYGPYPTSDVTNPTGPADAGSSRVVRGGSWDCDGVACRAAYRHRAAPSLRDSREGFRVAAVPSGSR
jgi:serine/threonine protein kinase/formylglycine-generating enzyme required for sulfatase activity